MKGKLARLILNTVLVAQCVAVALGMFIVIAMFVILWKVTVPVLLSIIFLAGCMIAYEWAKEHKHD